MYAKICPALVDEHVISNDVAILNSLIVHCVVTCNLCYTYTMVRVLITMISYE